jgi:hypothetical protein
VTPLNNSASDPEALNYWRGGFVEGEGSVCASVKVHKDLKYGEDVQPEFNVTQHENGKPILDLRPDPKGWTACGLTQRVGRPQRRH